MTVANFGLPGQMSVADAAINPTAITIYVQFNMPDGNGGLIPTDVDPDTGRVQFLANDLPIALDPLDSTGDPTLKYTIVPVGPPGLYKFSTLTTTLPPGIYTVVWTGTKTFGTTPPATHLLTVKGDLGFGEITPVHDILNRIRVRLMDDHPGDYQIDAAGINQWTKIEMFECVRDALSALNSVGPMRTAYNFGTIYTEGIDELLVTGGLIFCLYARARFELANTMSYSDGHTLNIDRAPLYKQLADTLMTDWTKRVEAFKKSHPARPIGIKSQRIPFRISRVLGLLPNYSTYFTG
jgi:hypothetical protein